MATLETKGMNGATLLGFLAAMGSLRLLSEEHPTAQMWFDPDGDRARLRVDNLEAQDAITACITGYYFSQDRAKELFLLGKAEMPKSVLNEGDASEIPSVAQLAKVATQQPRSTGTRLISGLLCDGLTKNKDDSCAAETVLCAANGASHQKMFQTIRDLAGIEISHGIRWSPPLVTADHLRTSLTEVWSFVDVVPDGIDWMGNRKPTLRWDESAERLHALRLNEPTADPEPFSTQLGAYALATAALGCFPTFPVRRGSLTSFTRRQDQSELVFHWPLWKIPATLATIQAIHLSGEALRAPGSARSRGVYRLMRARRQTQEKGKLTFQSAEACW